MIANNLSKSVGIITMHTPLNYGSYLQTVATFKIVESLGFKPTVINYRYPTSYHKSLTSLRRKKGFEIEKSWLYYKICGLCKKIIGYDENVVRNKMLSFYDKHILLTKPYLSAEDLQLSSPMFDIYLTGSDQVWNPDFVGEDTSYLLGWVNDEVKKISYSSSFGLDDLNNHYTEIYRKYLKKFSHISVREESKLVRKIIGHDCNVVLDPTLLLPKDNWLNFFNSKPLIKGKYILCYLLSYRCNPFPYAYKLINYIKKITGYKVVLLDADAINILKGYKIIANCGCEEFLNLFYNAEFIITSSFHGTAFSLNFEKPFISIIDDNNKLDNRITSIISLLNVDECCVVKKNTSLSQISMPNPKWEIIREKLSNLRTTSIKYLSDALNN